MEAQKLNTIRVTLGLGHAPNCVTVEVPYSDAEAASDAVMSKKRGDAINNAQKLAEEMNLVFSHEVQQATKPQAPPSAVGGSSQSANPTCPHGQMNWKEGTSKAGKHYAGYFCGQKGSDCAPVWPSK